MQPLVIVMIGLPGRGKTYISKRICRWLNWKDIPSRIFNCGAYRRDLVGASQGASYFGAGSQSQRDELCRLATNDMFAWIGDGGARVGILDATNHNRARRAWLEDYMITQYNMERDRIIWLEIICTDENMIQYNVRTAKVQNDDYFGVDPEKAIQDFIDRINVYQKSYERLDKSHDRQKCFIQWADRQLYCHRVESIVARKISYFLMNLSTTSSIVYMTTVGETDYQVDGKLGAQHARLTRAGRTYVEALALALQMELPTKSKIGVWTSALDSGRETAARFGQLIERMKSGLDGYNVNVSMWRALNEINHGDCDGMTRQEILDTHPAMAAGMAEDPHNYAYPRGENYHVMAMRLDPVLLEIENSKTPVLIVAHPCVLRGLIAFMTSRALKDVPHIDVESQTLMRFEYENHQTKSLHFPLGDAAHCTSGEDMRHVVRTSMRRTYLTDIHERMRRCLEPRDDDKKIEPSQLNAYLDFQLDRIRNGAGPGRLEMIDIFRRRYPTVEDVRAALAQPLEDVLHELTDQISSPSLSPSA